MLKKKKQKRKKNNLRIEFSKQKGECKSRLKNEK